MPNEGRFIEVEQEIAAPPADVWRALTDPEELVRWFPFQAEVTPGAGGRVKWAWDDKWIWESRIDLWEPERRLRLVVDRQQPFDVAGGVLPPIEAQPAVIVMDFTLRTLAGRTHLRLVHSGFGRGAAWDDEIDGVLVGWKHELRGLAFYLERHRGKERHVASAYLTAPGSQESVWQRLLAPAGVEFSPWPVAEGDRYVAQVSTGDRLDGIVRQHILERDFTGTVSTLNDGILRIGTHRAAGNTGISLMLATYDSSHAAEVAAIGQRLQQLLARLFPAAA